MIKDFSKYPRFREFLKFGNPPPNHFICDVEPEDPILPALEYFLSLSGIPGIKSRRQSLSKNPVNTRDSNAGKVAWAAMCAELGAICLLGQEIKLQLTGFDQHSLRSSNPNSNCDIRARISGKARHFEVKRNSVDDVHALPDELTEVLSKLDIKFGLSVKLVDIRYRCKDPNIITEKILNHLQRFSGYQANELPFLELPEMVIAFHDHGIPNRELGGVAYIWQPPYIRDIRSWILEEGKSGKSGKPMVPMIKQAEMKGADILMCRIPGWDELDKVVEGVFEKVRMETSTTFYAENKLLGENLSAVILFRKYNSYRIVNNQNAKSKAWLHI